MYMWVAFSFGLWQGKLLRTSCTGLCYVHRLHFLLGKYLGGGWWDRMVSSMKPKYLRPCRWFFAQLWVVSPYMYANHYSPEDLRKASCCPFFCFWLQPAGLNSSLFSIQRLHHGLPRFFLMSQPGNSLMIGSGEVGLTSFCPVSQGSQPFVASYLMVLQTVILYILTAFPLFQVGK